MAKSLGEMFGDAGRLAMGMRNIDVQEEQNRLYEERSKNNAQNDKLNVLMKLSADPAIRANRDQLTSVLTTASTLAGVPSISPESMQKGFTSYTTFMNALKDGKVEDAQKAFIEFGASADPADMDRMAKGLENIPLMQERMESMKVQRQLNQGKFEALHRNIAEIQAGERPLIQAVTDFSTIMHGTDTPDFRSVVKAAKVLQRPDGTSRADISALAQTPRTKLFQSQAFQQDAQVAGQAATRLNTLAGQTEALLDAHSNGADLPKDTTKQDLEARLKVATTLGDAYTTLGAWAQDPFNGEKLKAAKAAEKTIVSKRAEIEELKKTEASTRTEIAQDSLTFRQDKEGLKNAQLMATNRATNEFAQLPSDQRTPENAGKIADKHSNALVVVGANDVLLGGKDPNRPVTEVKVYNEKPSVAEAGKIASLEQSFTEMGMVRERLIHDDGTVDRGALVTAALNLPFTKGRDINMFVSKAVEIKLRAATGAAAPTHEVTKYTKDFAPSVKDSDELIRYKLDSMEEWLKATADITDPLGSLRERSNKLLSPGTTALLNSPDYKELRSANPRASSMHIMKFLQQEQALKRKDR